MWRASRRALLFGLVSWGALAAPARADGLTLTGTVRGADGTPKKFARVQLVGPGTYQTLTDGRGTFSLKDVAAGTYRVTITQGGFVHTATVNATSSSLDLVVKW